MQMHNISFQDHFLSAEGVVLFFQIEISFQMLIPLNIGNVDMFCHYSRRYLVTHLTCTQSKNHMSRKY